MRPFNRLARGWRSVPAAAGLMAALLLLAGLGIIFQSESAYREQKVREARVQAEILAATSALSHGHFQPGLHSMPTTDRQAIARIWLDHFDR